LGLGFPAHARRAGHVARLRRWMRTRGPVGCDQQMNNRGDRRRGKGCRLGDLRPVGGRPLFGKQVGRIASCRIRRANWVAYAADAAILAATLKASKVRRSTTGRGRRDRARGGRAKQHAEFHGLCWRRKPVLPPQSIASRSGPPGPAPQPPPSEPHHLNVARGLPFKPAARLNPVEIAVDVQLQQHRGMIRRPAGPS
jgi:hypothetical protein